MTAGGACVILVDTSVWIDHLRIGEPQLAALLHDGRVLLHPAVVGELALGHLSALKEILGLLESLPNAKVASDREVLGLIEAQHLFGLGIGCVDAHLLAAALLTGVGLWTRDKQLAAAATRLRLTGNEVPKD